MPAALPYKPYEEDLKYDVLFTAIREFGHIRLHSSTDLHDFIKTYTGGKDFVTWFNTKLAKKGYFGNYQFFGATKKVNGIPEPKKNNALSIINKDKMATFNNFWNKAASIIPGNDSEGLNLVQFVCLFCIGMNETGGTFTPAIEGKLKDLTYFFKTVPDVKISYNTATGNKTAYDLFNDEKFKEAHKDLKYYKDVTKEPVDEVWKADVYPSETYTTDTSKAGIIAETDFYKFRGRGIIQLTFRSAYKKLIEHILSYAGNEILIKAYKEKWTADYKSDPDWIASATTNKDWDALFQKTNLEIACISIRLFGEGSGNFTELKFEDAGVLVGEDAGSVKMIARLVAGKKKTLYHRLFQSRVIEILENLLLDYKKLSDDFDNPGEEF